MYVSLPIYAKVFADMGPLDLVSNDEVVKNHYTHHLQLLEKCAEEAEIVGVFGPNIQNLKEKFNTLFDMLNAMNNWQIDLVLAYGEGPSDYSKRRQTYLDFQEKYPNARELEPDFQSYSDSLKEGSEKFAVLSLSNRSSANVPKAYESVTSRIESDISSIFQKA